MPADVSNMPYPARRQASILKPTILLLGLAGMGISGYLTYLHYQEAAAICLPTMNCDAVLTSPYSQMWGVPLSVLGLLMYAGITFLGLLSLWGKKEWGQPLAMGLYGLALASLLFTIYLYYLEIFEIHAFCTWCIGSSIVVLAIFVLSLLNLGAEGFSFRDFLHYVRVTRKRYVQW